MVRWRAHWHAPMRIRSTNSSTTAGSGRACGHILTGGGMKLARRTMLLAGVVLAISGCGGKEPPPPPPPPGIVDLDIAAAPDVNPDLSGRPSPVTVTVYQLAERGALDRADFFQLSKPETLAADQRGREDVLLSPGEQKKLTAPLKEGARYIAIVAAFRAIDKASWSAVVEVPPHGMIKLSALLAGITLTLKPGGK
jgi:type VI secretion system protein VasD